MQRPLMLLYVICVVILLSSVQVISADKHQNYLSKLPPLIDRELFFGDPEISGSQLSPDGKYMSFIKPYQDVRNIYIKAIDQPFDKAIPITADERPVPGYFWSQDGKYILYVQDKGGNENFHVYAVDPQSKTKTEDGVPEARDLTPYEGIRAYIYAVPEDRPGEIIVGLNDRDAAYHDVYRIDIATGERELLITNTEKVGYYFYDLEGNVRLAVRQLPDGGTEVLRVDGEKLVQVYSVSYEESCAPIRFHKDGELVYMITNKGETVNFSQLVLFDPKSGEVNILEADPENRVDFGGALFDEQTNELIATIYVGDRVRIYPKEEQIKKDLALLRQKLPSGELSINSSTEDMRYHLVAVQEDVNPGSVYFYDRKTGDVKLQYRYRKNLPSENLAPMKAIRYKTRDGLEIPAYLTLPKGVEAKNLPTVIHPHGGPWARDRWGYDSYAQFLANRGYAVLQPNFRGSSGYGKKFLNAGNRTWGTGAMQHDISDGVQYLIDQGIADPDRIGIFGGSYGGYATLAGVTFTPDLYAAAVPYVAPSNLITLIESFPAYWRPFMKIWFVRVGDPEVEAERTDLIARSPLFKASEIKTPMLVVHGANDPRVKQAESDQIVIALRERGLAVEYLVAPDEGHGFRAPENRMALAVAMEKFLANHLGGRYQEDVSEALKEKLKTLMVDINSVTLPDTMMSAYASTAPLPQRLSERLTDMSVVYSSQMQVRGQEITVNSERSLQKIDMKGTPAWMIASSSTSPMGTATDTFYLDAGSLSPLEHVTYQGPSVVKLNYSDSKVSGVMKMGAQDIPVDVKLDAPLIGDGSAIEVLLSTLPLVEGYKTTFRAFDLLRQKIRLLALQVDGQESVTVPAGTFKAYKITISPLDGEEGGGTMFISSEKPYCMLRYEAKLPAMMGGGDVITELQKVN